MQTNTIPHLSQVNLNIQLPDSFYKKPVFFIRGALQYQENVGGQLENIQNATIWSPRVQHSAFSDDAYFAKYIPGYSIPGFWSTLWNWAFKKGPHFSSIDTGVEGCEISEWYNLYLNKITTWLKCIWIDKPFTNARTDPEHALDKILSLDRGEKFSFEMAQYIKTWPHTRPKDPVRYSNIMTATFIYAWSSLEHRTVVETSGGRYTDGDICGLDFNLLTHAQNSPPRHLYRTLQSCAHQSIIEFSPSRFPHRWIVRYRMVYQNGIWKLDGCCDQSTERTARHDANLAPHELNCAVCTPPPT